jgi:hypothetical protein
MGANAEWNGLPPDPTRVGWYLLRRHCPENDQAHGTELPWRYDPGAALVWRRWIGGAGADRIARNWRYVGRLDLVRDGGDGK